jgi:CheY-like chemotaxis protein
MFKLAIVADDSMLSRMVLTKYLKQLFPGIEVEQAVNGADAFDKFKTWESYDPSTHIIFLDFMMPEMNGLETLAAIRQESSDIPIYLVTANVQNKTRDEALRLGATGLIHKTMKINDLADEFGISLCNS